MQTPIQRFKDTIVGVLGIRERLLWGHEKKAMLAEARTRFAAEQPQQGSLADYKEALVRHRVSYTEYMYGYEFWRLDEEQRDAFISNSEVQCIYRALGSDEVRSVFRDKPLFLQRFAPLVQRRWARAASLSLDGFRSFIAGDGCVAKPVYGTHGEGIYRIREEKVTDVEALYKQCIAEEMLLEEHVRACESLEAFHPASLNTLRVVTISENDRCEVFGAILRMGTGDSVVDNTHGGGIFAPLDIETGRVVAPAIDPRNRRYEYHPDTGVQIVGFQVPAWKEVLEVCRRATRQIPGIRFAGWDLAVLPGNVVELIEGNHAPDFDGGMQTPLKIGVKHRLQETVQRVIGIDPLPCINYFS